MAISPYYRGIEIILIIGFSRNVAGPMPSIEVIRIICISVFGISTVPRFHPYNVNTRDHLDVTVFHSFPSMVTIGYYLINPIIRIIFEHIPLHILFDNRTVRVRIFVSYFIISRTEKFSKPFHGVTQSI